LSDHEIETLAAASGQRLVREFADKYANLRERVRRLPMAEAKETSTQLSCPLEVAQVASLVNLDGILSAKEAVGIISGELQRRATVGEDVPNISSNILDFSLVEGRWIEYIYGSFARELELKTRELSNLESAAESENITVEKALIILNARTKLAEGFIMPAIRAWLAEHPKSNSEDLLMAFGPAVTKWKPSTLKGKLLQLRRRNQAMFRQLRTALTSASESATVDATMARIDSLVDGLGADMSRMSPNVVAHFIVHIAPRPTGRGDKSRYVEVGVSSTRGDKTEPDMASPFDFLERDVRLARRRSGADQTAYLNEHISRVIRVLKYQGNSISDCVERCVLEIRERLHLQNAPASEIIEKAKAELADAPAEQRDEIATRIVSDFINSYVIVG